MTLKFYLVYETLQLLIINVKLRNNSLQRSVVGFKSEREGGGFKNMSIGESILHETFLTLYSKSEFFFLFLTHLINATTFFKRNFHGLVLFYITIFDYIELSQSNCAKNLKKNFKKNAEMLTYRRRSCRPTEIPFLLNHPKTSIQKTNKDKITL